MNFFLSQIHTEFQVDLPGAVADVQGGDESVGTGPPTSFVAWAEPDNDEDMEDACIELGNGSENPSEAFTPASNDGESCKEEISVPIPIPTSYQNNSEECKNGQGTDIYLVKLCCHGVVV